MLRSSCVNSGAQEIGFIYTSLLSVLLLASVTTSVSGVLQGNLGYTAQEEVEQVGVKLQLAIQDLLLAADEHPGATVQVQLATASENHGVFYKVIGTATGFKVISKSPPGGRFEASFPLAPASSVEGEVESAIPYIVADYDWQAGVVRLSSG